MEAWKEKRMHHLYLPSSLGNIRIIFPPPCWHRCHTRWTMQKSGIFLRWVQWRGTDTPISLQKKPKSLRNSSCPLTLLPFMDCQSIGHCETSFTLLSCRSFFEAPFPCAKVCLCLWASNAFESSHKEISLWSSPLYDFTGIRSILSCRQHGRSLC